jgi:hypothetical protein
VRCSIDQIAIKINPEWISLAELLHLIQLRFVKAGDGKYLSGLA